MDCDCGATTEGKWADIHSPNCASERFAPRHLDLYDLKKDPRGLSDPHRPRVSIYIDENIAEVGERPTTMGLTIGALWGQQLRFVELKSDEARRLARYLNELADALDNVEVTNVRV